MSCSEEIFKQQMDLKKIISTTTAAAAVATNSNKIPLTACTTNTCIQETGCSNGGGSGHNKNKHVLVEMDM